MGEYQLLMDRPGMNGPGKPLVDSDLPLADGQGAAAALLRRYSRFNGQLPGSLPEAVDGLSERVIRLIAAEQSPGYRGKARIVLADIGPHGGARRVHAQSREVDLSPGASEDWVEVTGLFGELHIYNLNDPELNK